MASPQAPTGQVALVTGGARGIGRAVAAFLLDAGIQVVLTGTNRQAAEETAAELAAESPVGALAHGIGCDVTDDASVAELAAFVRERCGRLDVLINNAGIGIYHPTPELSLEDFRRVVETNLTGVFRVTKALLPLLLEAAGPPKTTRRPARPSSTSEASPAATPSRAAPPTTRPSSGWSASARR